VVKESGTEDSRCKNGEGLSPLMVREQQAAMGVNTVKKSKRRAFSIGSLAFEPESYKKKRGTIYAIKKQKLWKRDIWRGTLAHVSKRSRPKQSTGEAECGETGKIIFSQGRHRK